MLVASLHTIARGENTLTIDALDTGERTGPDFRSRILERERSARCARDGVPIAGPADVPAPSGFEVVAFAPDDSCSVYEPPAVRLWVRMPDDALVSIELACARPGCLGEDDSVVEALVGSFRAGTPTSAPAGPRTLGAIDDAAIVLDVPEGYLVLEGEGEDYETYEILRRQPMGERMDSLLVSRLFTASPNTLEQDYARRDARTRRVGGIVGGRRTRLLEITRGDRTEWVARLSFAAYQLDFQAVATSPASGAELRAMMEHARLPEDD